MIKIGILKLPRLNIIDNDNINENNTNSETVNKNYIAVVNSL